MTNSVYQQKQQPTNYSGVTINITNPTVSAGVQTCTCPVREPNVKVITQNSPDIYGANQPAVPYYYNSSESLKAENSYYTGSNSQNLPNSVSSNQIGAQPSRQEQPIQYPQYSQVQQPAQMAQYQQYAQLPQQGQPVYDQNQGFVQEAQYNQVNQVQPSGQQSQQIQQAQASQNVQPAQYYLNNYNYNGVNPNAAPLSQTTSYSTGGNTDNKNMSISQGIINNLNERNAKQKELEENGEKKQVVALTNEYIMSLENYLDNPNTDIRLMASKEILTRLDEDRSRCDDAALNALLNKMLQDPEKIIRIAAMSALSSGLATGNDFTMKLLNNIQQDPNADREDALEVSQILLKMSQTSEEMYVPTKIVKEEAQNNA